MRLIRQTGYRLKVRAKGVGTFYLVRTLRDEAYMLASEYALRGCRIVITPTYN